MGNPPVCLGSFSEYPYDRHYPWGQSIVDVLARQIFGGLCIVLPLFMTTFLTAVGARLAIDSMLLLLLLLLRSSLLVLLALHRHRKYGVAPPGFSAATTAYTTVLVRRVSWGRRHRYRISLAWLACWRIRTLTDWSWHRHDEKRILRFWLHWAGPSAPENLEEFRFGCSSVLETLYSTRYRHLCRIRLCCRLSY